MCLFSNNFIPKKLKIIYQGIKWPKAKNIHNFMRIDKHTSLYTQIDVQSLSK